MSNTGKAHIEETLRLLPDEAGVYRFYDAGGKLLYVGKAKSLRKRVRSYFKAPEQLNRKTRRLVQQIDRIEYTVVPSEQDALLLENSLIKSHQPKYNILLKDDKTYPYICITEEDFPRILTTRRLDQYRGEYFGPYARAGDMYELLDLLKQLFTVRSCHLPLTPTGIAQGKFAACLEYHIGNCQAPCEGKQSREDYRADIEQVRRVLKGQISEVKTFFEEKMLAAAAELRFEEAQFWKEKIDKLQVFQQKRTVTNPKYGDLVVIVLNKPQPGKAYACFFYIREGAIIHTETFAVQCPLEDTEAEIAERVYEQMKIKYRFEARVPVLSNLEIHGEQLQTQVPQIGDKRRLIEMGLHNIYLLRKEELKKQGKRQEKKNQALIELQDALQLPQLPRRIECFDNSNIQGQHPVAAMVCFIDGKPAKSEYRKFHIKTVEGPDDFASMREVVYRRYKRQVEEGGELPQLIVIDGGKGQLNAALDALKALNLAVQIPTIGIAKRLEEIYRPGDKYPLHLSKKSPALRLIQHLRDEAHRFAITFHRDKRSKESFESVLTQIPGVAEKTAQKLLQHFRSVQAVREASEEALAQIVGKSKARQIHRFFHSTPPQASKQ
ncbi:excinuclease ABC subunit UvrC [Thermonema rossianum]|uniref:excinuclease ABC subunit UvrC n=1 Tax=Thermonema rossianum TaxID=55505 RepID=UPI0005712C16|nr:excinuclease ABC subunit UvrC [Thermonema rossianum]